MRARLLNAAALLHLGCPEQAKQTLEAGRWPAASPPRDYLRATIEARLGNLQEARRLLEACLAKEPGYASQALANPELRWVLAPGPSETPSGYA